MKTRFIKIVSAILSILLLMLCCSACAAKPDVLPDEEIAALREKYKYGQYSPTLDVWPPASLQERRIENYVYAIVTVTGEWTDLDKFWMAPNNEMAPVECTAVYLPVHVDSIICEVNCTDADLVPGDRILHFRPMAESRGYDHFKPGARFVMLLDQCDSCLTKYPDHYEGYIMSSFLITEDDRIVSLSPFPYMNTYTGWSLNSFENELKSISWLPPYSEEDVK